MINNITEANTYDYLGYQTLNFINSEEFSQPYTNNIPIVDNIYSVYDYNLRNEANKVSCEHQLKLHNIDEISNHNKLVINRSYIDKMRPIDYDYEKDLYMLLGREVTPKSCDVKKDGYDIGDWTHYHDNMVKNNVDNKIFNINTKSKLK
jgi:hypothetical protein